MLREWLVCDICLKPGLSACLLVPVLLLVCCTCRNSGIPDISLELSWLVQVAMALPVSSHATAITDLVKLSRVVSLLVKPCHTRLLLVLCLHGYKTISCMLFNMATLPRHGRIQFTTHTFTPNHCQVNCFCRCENPCLAACVKWNFKCHWLQFGWNGRLWNAHRPLGYFNEPTQVHFAFTAT